MWQKTTLFFLSSQALSLLGSSLVQYALYWHITLKYHSVIVMTVYIICGFIPTFILSPFGGVWADRFDRRKIIMLSDGAIAITTLALAFAFFAGSGSPAQNRLLFQNKSRRAVSLPFNNRACRSALSCSNFRYCLSGADFPPGSFSRLEQ